jgi:hypothetical protein
MPSPFFANLQNPHLQPQLGFDRFSDQSAKRQTGRGFHSRHRHSLLWRQPYGADRTPQLFSRQGHLAHGVFWRRVAEREAASGSDTVDHQCNAELGQKRCAVEPRFGSGPQAVSGGCRTCRRVVTVDNSSSSAKIIPNVNFTALAHASKFLVPGAVRIQSNTFDQGSLESVAFCNPDGSIVLLALNSGGAPISFNIGWKETYASYRLDPASVATFRWFPPAKTH